MRVGATVEIEVVRDNPVGEDIRELLAESIEICLHAPNAVGLLRQQSGSVLPPTVVVQQIADEQLRGRVVYGR